MAFANPEREPNKWEGGLGWTVMDVNDEAGEGE